MFLLSTEALLNNCMQATLRSVTYFEFKGSSDVQNETFGAIIELSRSMFTRLF
jgi:hypothetical protein